MTGVLKRESDTNIFVFFCHLSKGIKKSKHMIRRETKKKNTDLSSQVNGHYLYYVNYICKQPIMKGKMNFHVGNVGEIMA